MTLIQLGTMCSKWYGRNGKTIRCRRLREPGFTHCRPCRTFNTEYQRRATRVLNAQNKCRTCRGPRENPFKQNCDACRKEAIVRAAASGARNRAAGLCRCGKDLKPGVDYRGFRYKSCQSCIDSGAKRNARVSASRAGLRKLKLRRKAWLAAGLCERCGAPAPNGTQCDKHLRAHAERQRRYEGRERLVDD